MTLYRKTFFVKNLSFELLLRTQYLNKESMTLIMQYVVYFKANEKSTFWFFNELVIIIRKLQK